MGTVIFDDGVTYYSDKLNGSLPVKQIVKDITDINYTDSYRYSLLILVSELPPSKIRHYLPILHKIESDNPILRSILNKILVRLSANFKVET